MTSQIANRNAFPSLGTLRGPWRDWVGAAVLLLVWTTLWTVFTAGVLAPASSLAGRGAVAARPAAGRPTPPAGLAASPWVEGR